MATHITFFLACSLIAFCMVVSAQPSLAPQPFSSGPSVASGPASDECFNKLLNLSDCLTFVEAGSNLTAPDKPCCPELAGLVESSPICLCDLLGKSGSSFGIDINVTKALALPSVCKVSTPPPSLCSVVGVPVGVPSPSDGAVSPDAQPPGGAAAGPSTGTNGASSNAGSVLLAVTVGLATAFLI